MLLYMFLERKYEKTELVFIRHHTEAKECDEDEFFHSKETGGTVVSSAIDKLIEIQKDKYPESEWNVYVAQCSDGDNCSSADSIDCCQNIQNKILPICQYFAYIQTEYFRNDGNMFLDTEYSLWGHYDSVRQNHKQFEMKQVSTTSDIWKVFVELFKKQEV